MKHRHLVGQRWSLIGTRYNQLNYSDIALGNKYFNHLIKHFEVKGTPTMVIFNKSTNKSKKLEGTTQITEAKVMKAIDTLSTSSKKK